ncbi:MAG: hypothetical protein NT074_04695 [Methanomicrobiales archaeon]|nr:hypothetical protein [Methanomicrobiales archaeon]
MRHGVLLFLLFLASFAGHALAYDVTLTSSQKEYYVPTGTEAVLPLAVTSTFSSSLPGTLRFTITQEVQQQGFSFSSQNSDARTYTIPAGESNLSISLGTSQTPATLRVSLSFDYQDQGPKTVALGDLLVHFVDQQSPNQQGGGQVTSTTGTRPPATQQMPQTTGQDPLQQMLSQMQQQGTQRQSPQSPQQAVQNSQMGQDISALRDQLAREQAESQRNEEEFAKRLAADPLYQEVNRTYTDNGYGKAGEDLSPSGPDEGTFSTVYENPANAPLVTRGEMAGGNVTGITARAAGSVPLPDALLKNATYGSFTRQIKEEGFFPTASELGFSPGISSVNLTFAGPANRTATLNATLINGTLVALSSEIEHERTDPVPFLLAAIIVVVLVLAGYFLYRRYKRRTGDAGAMVSIGPPPDPRAAALALLRDAEEAFSRGCGKEAYELASEAARLYISLTYGGGKAMTARAAVKCIREQGVSDEDLTWALERCTLVEFARAAPDPHEFRQVVTVVEAFIKKSGEKRAL